MGHARIKRVFIFDEPDLPSYRAPETIRNLIQQPSSKLRDEPLRDAG